MSHINIPITNADKVDFKNGRSLYKSSHIVADDEIELLSEDITNIGYLTFLSIEPYYISATHTYDTSTFLHFCLGLEFNVYIDDQLFQTVHLSCARSGIPSSTTTTTSSTLSYYNYYFFSKEMIAGATVNVYPDPAWFSYSTVDAFVLNPRTFNAEKNTIFRVSEYNFRVCGISNGYDNVYVGEANTSHRATDDDINYGTIFPMVKINNNIRVTAKYLFFNNLPDATNTATFENCGVTTIMSWVS